MNSPRSVAALWSPPAANSAAALWPTRRKFAGVNSNSSYGALEIRAKRESEKGDLVDGRGVERVCTDRRQVMVTEGLRRARFLHNWPRILVKDD